MVGDVNGLGHTLELEKHTLQGRLSDTRQAVQAHQEGQCTIGAQDRVKPDPMIIANARQAAPDIWLHHCHQQHEGGAAAQDGL
jgi:hypothetical protein